MRKARIFVAALGASSFTFAFASGTQTLPDGIDAHVRALEATGGVPELIVPDNTKTAIIKSCLYDPQFNRTYAEMAALIVERWRLGRLRRRIFNNLADVNAAIADLMTHLNEVRPLRRLGVTRRQLLEEIDRPALKPLPAESYEFSEWKKCRVGISRRLRSNRPGLSHRGRSPLLQRLLSLRPHRGRSAKDGANRRGFSQRRTDRGAQTLQRQSPSTRRLPSTCRRAIAVTPVGRSIASAKTRRGLDRRWPRCAN